MPRALREYFDRAVHRAAKSDSRPSQQAATEDGSHMLADGHHHPPLTASIQPSGYVTSRVCQRTGQQLALVMSVCTVQFHCCACVCSGRQPERTGWLATRRGNESYARGRYYDAAAKPIRISTQTPVNAQSVISTVVPRVLLDILRAGGQAGLHGAR